jgi:hypothetical protein
MATADVMVFWDVPSINRFDGAITFLSLAALGPGL